MSQYATRDSVGDISGDYATTLPSSEEVKNRLRAVLEYWQHRNTVIDRVRKIVSGKNPIPVPKSTLFSPRIVRSFLLASTINEKRARFLSVPEVAVIPEGYGVDAQKRSSDIERALNEAMLVIDANGKNDAWDRAVTDAILLDEGIELIERAPAAFWPELVVDVGNGKTKLEMLYEDPEAYKKAKEEYKKLAGFPIRATYVPLESFFPVWEGHVMVEAFHIEYRSVRSVIGNRIFSLDARQEIAAAVGSDKGTGINSRITIVRYCNEWWYAYYALVNDVNDIAKGPLPDPAVSLTNLGRPILLYAYEHGLGRVPYNSIAGRYGGWRTDRNAIEPILNALVEMNQSADILLSQIGTNIGARYWPNLKVTLNPEFRGSTTASTIKPPQLVDGEPFVMYVGESIEPIFTPAADPMAQWMFSEIVRQFQLISGSRAIYGQREPGVDNGYQYNLQITQSEHLDEKIEMNLAEAVRERCEIIAAHIKAMDETVWVGVPESTKEDKRYIRYISLSPKDFYPMPRIDARVRKPKPIDFLTSLRAARDASADRRGRGTPLLSDDTIYEMILNIKEPDKEKRRIWIQNEMQNLLDSGFIAEKITERLNMKFFMDAVPLSQAASQADPALIAAMQQGAGIAAKQGGISPQVANIMQNPGVAAPVNVQGMIPPQGPQPVEPPEPPMPTPSQTMSGNQQPNDSGIRRVGGVPPGNPQYEQIIANAVRNGMRGGRI